MSSAISVPVTQDSNNVTKPSTEYALPLDAWIAYEICSVFLTSLALYTMISLLIYSLMQNKSFVNHASDLRRKVSERGGSGNSSGGADRAGQHPSTSSSVTKKSRRVDGTGSSARPLRLLCIFAALFALIRMAADQLELGTYYGKERVDCKLYQVVVVVTYSMSATCIYSALWFRLRIFLIHPVMKNLTTRRMEIVMWFGLILIILSSLLNTLIFTLATTAVDSELGCRLGDTAPIPSSVRYVILAVSTVASQVVLLFLFLFPLLKHRATMLKQTPVAVSYRPKSTSSHSYGQSIRISVLKGQSKLSKSSPKYDSDSSDMDGIKNINPASENRYFSYRKKVKAGRQRRVVNIMWRVLATAILCVVSDVLAAVISIAFSNQPRIVPNLLYNLNLMVNMFGILFSFGDWKDRLLPCFVHIWRKQGILNRAQSTSTNLPGSPGTPDTVVKDVRYRFDSSSAAGNSRGPISEEGDVKSDSVFE